MCLDIAGRKVCTLDARTRYPHVRVPPALLPLPRLLNDSIPTLCAAHSLCAPLPVPRTAWFRMRPLCIILALREPITQFFTNRGSSYNDHFSLQVKPLTLLDRRMIWHSFVVWWEEVRGGGFFLRRIRLGRFEKKEKVGCREGRRKNSQTEG